MTQPGGMDKAALKAAKKAKKAAAAAAAAGGEEPAAPAAAAAAALSADEKKKQKKQRKRDKKAAAAADAAAFPDDSEAAGEGADGEAPPKKKSKKAAAGPALGADGLPVGTAAVGDLELMKLRPRLVKALYKESGEVAAMSVAEVDAWRAERRIAVDGCALRPLTKFSQSGLSAQELHATRTFSAPSPIQAQCLPIALSGRDLVGIAATGSGKTLAFGLPALRHIRVQIEAGVATGRKPVALMVAPTRELAIQIAGVLAEAGERVGISSVCVYGGVSKREQVQALRGGVGVVVATPGRLEDLLQEGSCTLGEVSYLVLDEADRMLDLGFEPHIRAIAAATRADRQVRAPGGHVVPLAVCHVWAGGGVGWRARARTRGGADGVRCPPPSPPPRCPPAAQTLMFSATWPPAIRKLASEFLCHPARVTIGSAELSASHSVKQIVEVLEHTARDARLEALLRQYHSSRKNRVLVFVLYKKEATRVEQLLQRKGWSAAAVHGDISQAQRSAAVEGFKSGSVPLLVATDVAARGLDIPDVEVVINYSFPLTTEDYVHRIGRTGRAGKSGIAHTLFVGANDKGRAGELINVLREAKQAVPAELLAFGTTVRKKESKLYGAHFKDVDLSAKATKMTFDSDSD